MKLSICHLYGDRMNIYGDDGDITTIIKRCQWRGIETEVSLVTVGEKIDPKKFDFYFFGGGQDQQQVTVSEDLHKANGKLLKEAANSGAVMLAICGGYQLLGHYYLTAEGKKLQGAGILNIHTVASKKRMIGNISLVLTYELEKEIKKTYFYSNPQSSILNPLTRLVGFENHSGQTFLGSGIQPLGKIEVGFGNNGDDKTEGAWQNNVFGCYLHGSVLPKNPHFADFLISKALEKNYGKVELKPLDDETEWQAHFSSLARARQTK